MSNAQRIVLVVLAAAVIVGSLILFTPSDDGDDPEGTATQAASQPEPARAGKSPTVKARPPQPKATTLEVRGGEPVGGVKAITVKKGDTVRLVVSSDTTQEIHVHGYDLMKDAAPGKPARFTFKANVEGVFEVELEASRIRIAKLEVRPA
jgi:heme/copper-type cytochrome/quinol oxidase subunit 2